MTPEGKIKAAVKEVIQSLDNPCWSYWPVPMGYGRRGIFDCIVCYQGVAIGIETKKPGGKPDPWQEREAKNFTDARGVVWLIDTLAKVEEFRTWIYSF